MNTTQTKLHILLDSRESSVTLARDFFNSSDDHSLGLVEHIRGICFADRFEALLIHSSPRDKILVSVHHLPEEQLAQAALSFKNEKCASWDITLASYEDFPHMNKWCADTGCTFLANPNKKRTYPKSFGIRTDLSENKDLERIWVQYRLMLAIISRSCRLSDVCRELILGKADNGDTIEQEAARALRYFKLGEPDMAGGSYASEGVRKTNAIDELRSRVNKVAATDFNVLIKGDSGSGKEAIAWAIHELSSRRNKPFLAINCAGLPDELLESEMFGYQRGSHNQAFEDAQGLLDAADGGTLFLDELPDMSPRIQAKLLRFIESGEYRPLGSTKNRYSDIRIIAAGQPIRLNAAEALRPDLKSRVGQLDVEILPLREVERRSPGTLYKIAFILLERFTWTTIFHDNDIRELTPCHIKKFQNDLALPNNMALLTSREWRESNIRELINFLRRWIVFGDDEFRNLKQPPSAAVPGEEPRVPAYYDEELRELLLVPGNREELKNLFSKKPLQNLKKSYIRHLFKIYSRIVECENTALDTPRKPTQKEMARLMGVTENTISRHLN